MASEIDIQPEKAARCSERAPLAELLISLAIVLCALLATWTRLRGDQAYDRSQQTSSRARLLALEKIDWLRGQWRQGQGSILLADEQPIVFESMESSPGAPSASVERLHGEIEALPDALSESPGLVGRNDVLPVRVRVYWSDARGDAQVFQSHTVLPLRSSDSPQSHSDRADH